MDPARGLDDLRSLLEAPAPAVLVTYGRDGSAAVSPVWFRYTGDAFEVVVAKNDVKLRHLARDPRAVLMIFEAVAPFRGVKIRAAVELDDSRVEEVRRAISSRYLGPETAEAFVARRGEGVVVRLPAPAARLWDLSGILPVTTRPSGGKAWRVRLGAGQRCPRLGSRHDDRGPAKDERGRVKPTSIGRMRFPGLGSWIERRAARSPTDVALIAEGTARSYLDLATEVRAIAELLQRNGVGPGDRVAFHGRNHPVALGSLFATAAIGAVWVPIHPARPEDEVRAVLEDSEPRVLIRASPATHVDTDVLAFEAAELDGARGGSEAPARREPAPDDLAILAYTSGTTGAPKGVMLSHANITWDVIQMMAACSFAPSDVTLAAAPFTRMGGLGVTVLPTLFAGGTVVVPPAAEGGAVLATIERARVTVLFANPDLLEGMVRASGWESADLSSVRTGVVGGGLVHESLLRAYLDRGVMLLHGYGLTEAGPVVSLVDEREAATRTGSVGKPLPFIDVRALRPDGSACGVDEIGEWWIRGPNVTLGYWRRPPVRDEDGWFLTGDVGSIDADGYLTFLDRASAAMRVGGAVVYPATIERALYGAPGLADAAAVDVDGRIVAAVVTEAPVDLAHLLETLRSTLAPHEVPSEIRTLEEIPRNASGKVRRAELRQVFSTSP